MFLDQIYIGKDQSELVDSLKLDDVGEFTLARVSEHEWPDANFKLDSIDYPYDKMNPC